jgi:hypothetical protein
MKHCWAHIIGGCSDKFSKEHYVGRKLFANKTVTTHGLHAEIDGKSRLLTDLEAHILCATHNNLLSDVDKEAIRLEASTDQWFRQERIEDLLEGTNLWTPAQCRVNGSLFSHWLCKLHCNMLTLKNRNPPEYYVRYSFGERTDPALRFHVRSEIGSVASREDRLSYKNLSGGPCPSNEFGTFYIFFWGIEFLVCPYDLTEQIKAVMLASTSKRVYEGDWTNKPAKTEQQQHGITVRTLLFDW